MTRAILIGTLVMTAACGSISATGSDGGTGGTPGTGGATGTGGAMGTGGHGGGGQGGGPSCDQIQASYKAALTAAKACTAGDTTQCKKTVPNQLGCNGCPTFVNDDSGLMPLEDEWSQAGCNQGQVCTNIACIAPTSATCKPGDTTGAGPMCVDVP